MITIKKRDDLKKYYVKETNTYVFEDEVKFEIDINLKSNINAHSIDASNINAHNINAHNINASNINAWSIDAGNINASNINAHSIDAHNINASNINASNINAHNINASNINASNINALEISYYAFCVSYNNIECVSIKGRRDNSFHKCLDGELIFKKKTCLDEKTEEAIKHLQEIGMLGKDFKKYSEK